MLNILFADCSALNDEEFFRKALESCSVYRREKVQRFLRREDKNLSLGAAILIDKILVSFGASEKEITYLFGENGKPYFAEFPDLHFNISHSANMVMAAFGTVETGCDIEKIKPVDLKLAKRFFAPSEYEYLRSFENEEGQQLEFYRLWTLKESYMKATGRGMSLPFNGFSISVSDDKISVECESENSSFYFGESSIIPGYCTCWCTRDMYEKTQLEIVHFE